jgi:hypothetical protein
MNDELLRDYAEWLIVEHAYDVERMSVWEMEDAFRLANGAAFSGENGELSDDEHNRVMELIGSADVRVEWG